MLRQQSLQSRTQEHSRRPGSHFSASSNCHRRWVEALRANSQCASRAPASRAAMPNGVRRSAPSTTCCRFFRGSRKFKAAAASPHVWTSLVRGRTRSQHAPARRGLTPPSSRAPTAKHQARATVQCIICSAGLAFFCWCRLMSNVRPRGKHLFMRLLAPSPALMNTSLRPRRENRRAPAADTKDKNSTHCFGIPAKFISGGVRDGVKALRASSQSPSAGGNVAVRLGKFSYPAPRAEHFMPGYSVWPSEPPARSSSTRHSVLCRNLCRRAPAAWPNPSIKPSPNGKPPGQRYSAVLHFLQRWPGVSPLVPAYVER